jgi:hypothetical protein
MTNAAAILILFSTLRCLAQTDNTFYVKQFPGVKVGQKDSAAMLSCNANPVIPCLLVPDSVLAAHAHETMPTVCSRCILMDYRQGSSPGSVSIINSIPQADQFEGADICAKIRAAATFGLSAGIGQVDATHFSGTQACATNMLTGLCTPSVNSCALIVNLGAVHIQSSVAQSITNTGVSLHGMGPMQTQLEYVGASVVPAILTLGDTTNGEQNNQITGIFIYGDSANATDGMLVQATFHSQFRDVWTWGVTNCGIHEEHGVTNTYDTPRTSMFDAIALGIHNSGHSQPTSAWCSDTNTVGKMTGPSSNALVLNPAAEGVSGPGFNFINDINSTIMGGTSEDNPIGVVTGVNTQTITLMTMDLEANTVNDVLDNGDFNAFINDDMQSPTGKSIEFGANSRLAMLLGGAVASIQQDPGSLDPSVISGGIWALPLITSSSEGYAVGPTSNVVIPSTATGNSGNRTGMVELVLTGTTSIITGTALHSSCDSGTVYIQGANVGHPVAVSSTSGADIGVAFSLRASVTSLNTVTVYICGSGTPPSLAYNFTVF